MIPGGEPSAADVLATLADLAPNQEQEAGRLTIPTEYFRWLPLAASEFFHDEQAAAPLGTLSPVGTRRGVQVERAYGERLAAIAQIRPLAAPLRVGWLFVAGRVAHGAKFERVFHPLVTIPVRVVRSRGSRYAELTPAGDIALSERIPPGDERDALEARIEFGGGAFATYASVSVTATFLSQLNHLREFARAAAAAAGFAVTGLRGAGDNPMDYLKGDALSVLAGAGAYVTHETGGTSRAASLRAWIDRSGSHTAFHSVYLGGALPAALRRDTPVESPYLLTPTQKSAVERSRTDAITVVSGAPGTGKSQTIVAMACDALAAGESVLVTARSDATVDALIDLFERAPGPEPVVFGSNERRIAFSRGLEEGLSNRVADQLVTVARQQFDGLVARRDACRSTCLEALLLERLFRDPEFIDTARGSAPRLFDTDTDLPRIRALLTESSLASQWWFGRWQSGRAHTRACALAGVGRSTPPTELAGLVSTAETARRLRTLELSVDQQDEAPYDELLALEASVRDAAARWLDRATRSDERIGEGERRAVAALATALRSGRAARREQLKRLDPRLVRALPLWVGSLPDVDDLLPHIGGLFDVVLIDEASSIDQPLAAPALLRGRRGVVVGDPRQLRHVSFLADERLEAVLSSHDISDDAVSSTLDVRRNSLFDVAASAGPVTALDEHFRSDPHLVEFVANRVYDGTFAVATRSPLSQSRDCISAIRCTGTRDKHGVVAAEVDVVIRQLERALHRGERSVGVITPFRAQADSIETAVLAAFTVDELELMDVRLGTVHSFQGNERDLVIISVGIGPAETGASWRFVDDPHLFAVLATRARKQVVLLYSADPPMGGLLNGYLAQADSPPGAPRPARPLDAWGEGITAELCAAGFAVHRAYPVGRHVVDICIGGARVPMAITTALHEDGELAHLDRHLALRLAGWEVIEAAPARWNARRAGLMVMLLDRLAAQGISAG